MCAHQWIGVNELNNCDNYAEYFVTRKPATFAQPLITYWHKKMLLIAAKWIPNLKSKTILEIGAGHGFFASVCTQMGFHYCGHEMNADQANSLQASGYDVTPAMIPPIPAGKPVQVIWLSHVLEHAMNYREARDMLTACHGRLDKDGYVVIIAPDIHHWKMEFWSMDWSHGFPTSLNRVEQLLNETGFSVTKAMHHTSAMTNPCVAWVTSSLFRLLPMHLIDSISHKLVGRRFASAFMSVFGFRQIYLIGHKN